MAVVPSDYFEDDWIRQLRKRKGKPVKKAGGTILVYDTGLALDHALRFVEEGHRTYYFLEWRAERYQRVQDYVSGYGYEGLNKVLDWGMVYGFVRYVMFTDVGFGSLADLMRSSGKYVFGSSALGEQLELDRVYMHMKFEELGIGVPKYKVVKGVSSLMNSVENGREQYIKLNIWRGNLETLKVSSKEELRIALESARFGKFAEEVEFMIVEPLDGVEIGVDVFFNGREFLRPYNFGNEVKGTGNQYNKWVEKSIWDDVLEKLEPWLRRANYRGSISLEGFYDGSKISVIDVACRLPYPGGSAIPRYIKNYCDVVLAVSRGEYLKPEVEGKYSCNLLVVKEDANSWTKVTLTKDVPDVVFPRCSMKVSDSEYWSCPGDKIVAVVMGAGDSYEEAVNKALENVKLIKGNVEPVIAVETYTERFKKLKEWGVW